MDDHSSNEKELVRSSRTKLMIARKEIAYISGISSLSKALTLFSKPAYGPNYLIEYQTEEMDETPIYACALPYCKVHHKNMKIILIDYYMQLRILLSKFPDNIFRYFCENC